MNHDITPRPTSTPRLLRLRRRAFTLVEILVVISIIALLIGILLPVLSSARSAARDSVCVSNMKQIGIGLATYATDNDKYFPGPNTSGRVFNPHAGPTSPTMKGDWYSPMFGDSLSLPANRNDRIIDIFGEKFRCPNNDRNYDYAWNPNPGDPPATTIPYNSYSMPSGFSYYYDEGHAASRGDPNGRRFGNNFDRAIDIRKARNMFKTTTVGPPSGKVFALDGARYLDSSGRISYNGDGGTNFGDNFSTRGPALNALFQDNGNPYKAVQSGGVIRAADDAKEITYRHGAEPAVNAVFFDGRGEMLSDTATRDVDLFFPSGSVVVSQNQLADPDARNGDIIK